MAEKKARKPLTEEEKAKRAEALRKAREAKKAKAEAEAKEAEVKKEEPKKVQTEAVKDSKDEEIELLKQQIELLKQQMQKQKMPQVIQVAPNTEQVHFLWQAPVADENVVLFGENGMYGRVQGKIGEFYVPKTDLSRVLTGLTRKFLDKRWLIVLSGLTDEEREVLGVDYKDGEYIDKKTFMKLPELGVGIIEVYKDLCDGHKALVEKMMYEEYTKENPKIKREVVAELSKLCKSPANAFKKILELMNEEEAK